MPSAFLLEYLEVCQNLIKYSNPNTQFLHQNISKSGIFFFEKNHASILAVF